MTTLIYLCSLLAPRRLRAAWREEWLGELHAARRAGGARALRLALGAPFDALSSRWTTQSQPGSRWQGPWRSDLLQTVRALRRSPGHVAVVALCLGVGIAVCTTTFSILNAFSTGEIPGVRERARIGRLHLAAGTERLPDAGDFDGSSAGDYEIMRQGSPSFSAIAAEGFGRFAVRVEGRSAMSVDGGWVSGNYFDVLGTQPHLGRLLQPSDDRPDAPLAVAISHAFWTARLGAPTDIVGKTIVIGGRDAVVTGVAPQGFGGLRGGEMNEASGFGVYVPLAHLRDWPGARRADQRWLNVYGRLTVPMDRERLSAELLPLAGRIEATDPVNRRNARIAVTESWLTPGATNAQLLFLYALLLSAPLTVLAIGCANVANLQLVRASLRTRELAVRVSLGASRSQIIRLLTFEALLLVAAASATSALGIWILLRVAALVLPIPIHLDTRVMLFIAVIAALVIGFTGLLPGLISTRASVVAGLRSGGRSMSSGNSRVRRGLVVAQVTLCFLLLLAAGVFTRGLYVITGQMPAHAPHTLITELRFDVQRDYGPAERRAFLDAFDARMRADGRVRGIAYTSSGPLSNGSLRVWRAGDPLEAGKFADAVNVEGDYFDVSGVHVLRGRGLTKADAAAMTAVVVNDAFIADFQLAEPAVGQSIRVSVSPEENATPRHVTIVGVASAPVSPAFADFQGEDPTIYLPLPPSPNYIAAWISADNAALLTDSVRRTIADLDPEMPALAVRTLEDHFEEDNETLVMIARTAGGLGVVALLLAVSGLYSVIAFFVALRTSEFGIRVALGARSADIVQMVLGQALRLAAAGLAVGAVLGTPLLIALHANFPFTQRFDPVVILPTALVLALTALVAGWVPARRASTIQASVALRAD
ncbi:MAG: ABC transporter permease [Acidobacteriota bacterium]|nr:ABC transporter permease [Acidobacteriota bacterium]